MSDSAPLGDVVHSLVVWEAWWEIHLSRVLPTLLVVLVLGVYLVHTELLIADRASHP